MNEQDFGSHIKLKDYTYHLPEERIAKYPLKQRDASKLMVYRNGDISHRHFYDLPEALNGDELMVFNNTKVLPARLFFEKETGALIEVFLLHPLRPTPEVSQAMLVKGEAVWQCKIGNLKRWKDGQSLRRELDTPHGKVRISADLVDREKKWVRIAWGAQQLNFADVIQLAGVMPIPPYLRRETEAQDAETYQTVYSKEKGAVAAPTAGLHFTEKVMQQLRAKGITLNELTLHVGAGTFQPITAENVTQHDMHKEQMVVGRDNLAALLQHERVVAVGTTSMRTLESLYWYGAKLLLEGQTEFFVAKLQPYQMAQAGLPTKKEAFEAVLQYMREQGKEAITGETEVFIFPGYRFKVCDALVTNYHMPESTLVLLIASFIGDDWRKVYRAAMDNDYRFLSYGDSSLLFRNDC